MQNYLIFQCVCLIPKDALDQKKKKKKKNKIHPWRAFNHEAIILSLDLCTVWDSEDRENNQESISKVWT